MKAKFSEAFLLLARHIGLFTAIVLSVCLPRNLLFAWVARRLDGSSALFANLSIAFDLACDPFYIGALVYSLNQIKSDRPVRYLEAMAIGIRGWPGLFAARLVASVRIFLGFLALVVPGFILGVRYSLLDPAVVIEHKGISQSLARSIELTRGHCWPIFWSWMLLYVVWRELFILVSVLAGPAGWLKIYPVAVAISTILSAFYAVLQIVLFLFYWESVHPKKSDLEVLS